MKLFLHNLFGCFFFFLCIIISYRWAMLMRNLSLQTICAFYYFFFVYVFFFGVCFNEQKKNQPKKKNTKDANFFWLLSQTVLISRSPGPPIWSTGNKGVTKHQHSKKKSKRLSRTVWSCIFASEQHLLEFWRISWSCNFKIWR